MFELIRNLPWKKIGLVILFLAVSGAAGYGLYFLFFKPAPTPEPTIEKPGVSQLPGAVTGKPIEVTPGTQGLPSGTPNLPVMRIPAATETQIDTVASGRITKVTDLSYQKAEQVALAATGDGVRSYDSSDGKFYKITADGERVAMSDTAYKNIENVAWSNTSDQAILEFPDGTNVMYDFDNQKQITLPKDWAEFQFSDDGGKLAFKDMNANPDYQWLAIANPDGSGQKYLEPLGTKASQFHVNWSPTGNVVAEYRTGKSGDTSSIYFVGQNNENFRTITANGYGVESKWAPDGEKLLYSAHSFSTSNKPMLYIVDAAGDNIGYNHQSLNLNTWADKCAFADKETMYCAVPKELPEGADLLPSIADSTPDYLYKVNVRTGVKSFIAEPEYGYTIDQIMPSENGEDLFFTDKQTGTLHSIKLK